MEGAMVIRELRSSLQGDVVEISGRRLSERELIAVFGGGPTINPGGGDDPPTTITYAYVNGVMVPNDCGGDC